MADTKLSGLPELAAAPAVDDEIYIRDVSEAAADESKRIVVANLLASRAKISGTPTDGQIAAWTDATTLEGASYGTLFLAASDATAAEKARCVACGLTVCDGTADEVQINAALAADVPLILSSGNFVTAAPITAALANITIRGQGIFSTIITLANTSNCHMITVAGAGWTLSDFQLQGNSANNTTTCGIYARGNYDNLIIERVYIDDTKVDGINVGNGVDHLTVRDCKITATVGNGIHSPDGQATASTDFRIIYNEFTDCGIGSALSAILLTGNANTDIQGVIIANNTFVNSEYLDVYLLRGSSGAGVIRNVVITGNNSIDSGGIRSEGAENVTIAGNTLYNVDHSGILVNGSVGYTGYNIVISGNTIDTTKYSCIDIQKNTNAPANVIVISNSLANAGLSAGDWAAIHLTGADNCLIAENIMFDNRGTKYMRFGIMQDGNAVTGLIIKGNNIHDTEPGGGQGIDLAASCNAVVIEGNKITGVPNNGILVRDADDPIITDNRCLISGGTGLNINYAAVVRAMVTNNSFQGCATEISSGAATTPRISSNIDKNGAWTWGDNGYKTVSIKVFDDATAVAIGDGKFHFFVPATLTGMNLVAVSASVSTVSSSGLPTIQIHNLTDASDMLSTLLTIDANEKHSKDAATPAVINAAEDDVVTGDELRIDVDVAGTGTKGLTVDMTFQLP